MTLPQITSHLQAADPILGRILEQVELRELTATVTVERFFEKLTQDIVSQQLSTKVADIIIDRFVALFPQRQPTPELISAMPIEQLRAVGLSGAKVKYIKDLADKTMQRQLAYERFNEMDNEQIIIDLTQVKGIGRWTAEMFLIFTLGRTDVFSAGDLGLKNALVKWYPFDAQADFTAQVNQITERWAPYRSYGSLALWRSLELK